MKMSDEESENFSKVVKEEGSKEHKNGPTIMVGDG